MNNPLRRLRQIPWTSLFWTSLLTLFWASVIDQLLRFGLIYVDLIGRALTLLFTPPLNIIVGLAAAMGLGALAVVFLEILYPQMMISTGVLWSLLLCLFLMLVVRSLLPLPTILLEPSYSMLIGAMLGIFIKGKPYWR
jgi:hypothetical protein